MSRPSSESLTPREAEIMDCLWHSGSATAEQIREQLAGGPHDSSVRTLLRVLEEKGYVGHNVQGKAYVYFPLIAKSSAQSQATTNLLKRLFRGSAASLVLKLLEDDEISPEELQRLAKQVRSTTNSPDTKRPGSRKKP
jgi:BlaI family transcriptional regulator, penicillinase repressor